MQLIRVICRGVRRRPRRAPSRLYNARAWFLVLASLVLIPAALASDLDKVSLFNIQAQSLGSALLQFGAQAHVQISFASDSSIARLQTRGIKGTYSGKQALAELLRRTRLRYVTHKKTVAILPKSSAATSTLNDRETHSHLSDDAIATYDVKLTASDPPAQNSKVKQRALKEIVVTGSRIPTTSKYEAQEVQIYDRLTIDQSGQTSVADFLSTLPSASVTQPAIDAPGFTETVQLRGLPVGTTLVLLDGRSVEDTGADGGQYFNLSLVPLAAVQRIEVEENGSSALYGSEAIAGVVNIILKKDFNGFAANARYGWAKGTANTHSSLALGRQWGRGGISVIGSYETDTGLLNSERALTASNDYTRFGGPDNNYPNCSPGNVFSLGGAPLPGGPAGSAATYAAVTGSTLSGKPPLSQFTYGSLNECALSEGGQAIQPTKRGALLLNAHQDISPEVTAFTQLMYTRLNVSDVAGDQYLFGTSEFQEFTVPAGNPFNPFGEDVGVTENIPTIPTEFSDDTNLFRPLIGLRGVFADRWRWEVSAWQSIDWTTEVLANEFDDAAAIQNALDSPIPASALNPFIRGPLGPQELLQPLFSGLTQETMGSERSAQGWIRGPLARLPAGELEGVLGAEYDGNTFHTNLNVGSNPYGEISSIATYHRTEYAVFGEVRAPLIPKPGRSGSLVEVTASGRYDHYSDFAGDGTEQFGIEVEPARGLLLRASYGTAFAAPTLQQLYSPQTVTENVGIDDPVNGQFYLINLLTGGNPSLRPLTGRSRTVGIIYSVPAIRDLLLSITQWDVQEDNEITAFPDQLIVDNPMLFPGRGIRDAAGKILEIDDTNANFGSIDVAGVDYQVDYKLSLGGGIASIQLGATETYRYQQALLPSSPPVDAVSIAQSGGNWAPRWRGTIGVGWTGDSLTARVSGRYVGSYEDYGTTQEIGNFWILDTDWRWPLGKLLHSRECWSRGAYVEFGGTNLLNRAPQFSNYLFDTVGFDMSQASIVGRSLYVNVGVDW